MLDVPTEETTSPRQVALPFARPLPNDHTVTDETAFCSTCLKNQHLLTETLANYLPSPDDPAYDQYVASYPEYRKKLEERYPPVCARCEPKARMRIQQAAYVAKSDHLRRVIERSRLRRLSSRWDWRSLVVTLGAVLSWASIVGQVAWNLICILEDQRRSFHKIRTALALRPVQCAAQVFKHCRTDLGCAAASAPVGFVAIILGFLSSWWNPKWQHKLERQEGRLVGLQRYYQVHMTVLLARFGFWIWAGGFKTLPPTELGHDVARKVSHSLAMAMTLVLTMYSYTRVRVDTTPLVSWRDSPTPLLSQRQYIPHAGTASPQPCYSSPASRAEMRAAQPFPISSLAPEPRQILGQAPPPAPDLGPDEMEWEPSRTFRPKPQQPKVSARPAPSPFHGALPAAPTNRLLHPQARKQGPSNEAIGLPPGFFDNRECLQRGPEPPSLPPMAQPKFFPKGDREADTGLESIFDAVFSLRDVPVVGKTVVEQNVSREQNKQVQNISELPYIASKKPWYSNIKLNVRHAAKLVIFTTCSFLWYAAADLRMEVPHVKLVIICVAGMVSLSSAIAEGSGASPIPDVSDLIWSGVMVFGATFLAFQQWSHGERGSDEIHDQTGMIFFFICSCWEFPRMFGWSSARSSEKVIRPYQEADPMHEFQSNDPPASEAGVRLQSLRSSRDRDVWQSSSTEPQLSVSQLSRWRSEQPSEAKPPSLHAPGQRPLYRTRSNSEDSPTTQSSVSSTVTATSAGWKTPTIGAQHSSGFSGQSPGFNLRSLRLVDGMSTSRRQEQNGLGNRSRRY